MRRPHAPRWAPALALGLALPVLVAGCGSDVTPRSPASSGLLGGAFSSGCRIPDDFVTATTVEIAGGAAVPRCVFAPAGASLRFVNRDARDYAFIVGEDRLASLLVPAMGSAAAGPVPEGGITFTCYLMATGPVVVLAR